MDQRLRDEETINKARQGQMCTDGLLGHFYTERKQMTYVVVAHAYVRYSYLVYYVQHSARDLITPAGTQHGDNSCAISDFTLRYNPRRRSG